MASFMSHRKIDGHENVKNLSFWKNNLMFDGLIKLMYFIATIYFKCNNFVENFPLR